VRMDDACSAVVGLGSAAADSLSDSDDSGFSAYD
jgi:hypothetical protein